MEYLLSIISNTSMSIKHKYILFVNIFNEYVIRIKRTVSHYIAGF